MLNRVQSTSRSVYVYIRAVPKLALCDPFKVCNIGLIAGLEGWLCTPLAGNALEIFNFAGVGQRQRSGNGCTTHGIHPSVNRCSSGGMDFQEMSVSDCQASAMPFTLRSLLSFRKSTFPAACKLEPQTGPCENWRSFVRTSVKRGTQSFMAS